MLQNADKTVIRRFQSFFITNTALRHSGLSVAQAQNGGCVMVRHSRVVASYLKCCTVTFKPHTMIPQLQRQVCTERAEHHACTRGWWRGVRTSTPHSRRATHPRIQRQRLNRDTTHTDTSTKAHAPSAPSRHAARAPSRSPSAHPLTRATGRRYTRPQTTTSCTRAPSCVSASRSRCRQAPALPCRRHRCCCTHLARALHSLGSSTRR